MDDEPKPGQAQLIAQAWKKHEADRRQVSLGARQAQELLQVDYQKEMDGFMNETFVTVVGFGKKPVFVSEVYTHSQRVMKEARRRGRKCGTAMSLENGWGCRIPAHREAAKAKVEEEKPFFWCWHSLRAAASPHYNS